MLGSNTSFNFNFNNFSDIKNNYKELLYFKNWGKPQTGFSNPLQQGHQK